MRSPDRTFNFDADRALVWFSCGATSAIAAKIAVQELPKDNLEILYCDTGSEHPTNQKFLKQVEEWIDFPIKILKSEKYNDIWDVFEKTGWLVGPKGARCTLELKKSLRQKYEEFDDIQIFGFDNTEKQRAENFIFENQEIKVYFPLIEKNISKIQCLEIVRQSNVVDMPLMYQSQKSGAPYGHNNCIGCVKGQMGYWNKIRVDFPDVFERMASLERKMGVAINKSYAGGKGRKKVFLDELDPNAGRYEDEEKIDCDMFCKADAYDFLEKENR